MRDVDFVEICLQILNNDLKHFRFVAAFVLIPTIVVFVLFVWVVNPKYAASAIVAPPANSPSMVESLSGMLDGSSSMISLQGLYETGNDEKAVWTILNSWELHDMVVERFNLAEHYGLKGRKRADLLNEFRKNFGLKRNKEEMFFVYFEDADSRLAVQIVEFVLEKADSVFNAFKTRQARQASAYLQSRLDSCKHVLDSLVSDFVNFQMVNDVYEPSMQLDATIKYLSGLQNIREEVDLELNFEKLDRGESSKRYQELLKRMMGVNSAFAGTLNGMHSDIGIIKLQKSPQLYSEFLRRKSEIRIQEAMYKMLRQQSELMHMEEAKRLTNLLVLEPPWKNDKKIFPMCGLILTFTIFVTFFFASLLCNFKECVRSEGLAGSVWT